MEIISGHKRARGFSKDENKRRYALHSAIRKMGVLINSRSRIVFVPLGKEIDNPQIIELGKVFGYQIQTEAFTENT